MKKIFLPVIAAALLLSACEKQLEQQPLSEATTATFYKTQNDFLQAVNAVYANLRSYPDRILNLSETRSDNLYAVSEGGVRDWEGINSFHQTIASNPYIKEAWLSNFNGIYKANTLLEQLEKNSNVFYDATLPKRIEAEARFLRAFFYFDLVRTFGKVPLITKTVNVDEALNIPRATVSEVYDVIISDLQFAATNLPAAYSGANAGRATMYAAKGLLALVHMTRSGPTYGIEGPGLGLNEWGQALTLLNEIINSGNYDFLPNYASIFAYNNEGNKEVIFDIQYISGGTGLGGTFPGLLVPDQYFTAVGVPFPGGLTIRPVSNDLLNSYEARDVRKAFNFQPGYTFGTITETRAFVRKYLNEAGKGKDRFDWPINFIVMRFTDVLMLKAECILHGAPGTQGEVDAIVNRVRQRAGVDPVSNVTLDQLMEERRREFAGEGLRWYDLVRSGQIETVMNTWIQEEDVQGRMKPFVKDYIIYPIPQSELDVKRGLYAQNPGY